MNTPNASQILQDQLERARGYLHTAAGTSDIALAKFALGVLTGAIVAAAPLDDHYRLNGIGYHGQNEADIERVLDAASVLTQQGYGYAERLQIIEREARRG